MEPMYYVTPQEEVLHNSDILFHITNHLCLGYSTRYIRKDFRALSLINKLFYDYYSTEKNKQRIIRTIVCNNHGNDESVASVLCCHTISKKIKYFIDIAENKDRRFTQEDLKEKWYLHVTDTCYDPLAYIAIKKNNFEIAQLIMDHSGLDLTDEDLENIKSLILRKILLYGDNDDTVAQLTLLHFMDQNKK